MVSLRGVVASGLGQGAHFSALRLVPPPPETCGARLFRAWSLVIDFLQRRV